MLVDLVVILNFLNGDGSFDELRVGIVAESKLF